MTGARYRKAGVDIEAGEAAVGLLRTGSGLDTSTFAQGVAVDDADPSVRILATTDGVGTKTLLAASLGRLDGLGADLVNHCVNDLLAAGGRPRMFLDYIGMHRTDPGMVALLVDGMRRACAESGCELVGGETAEMPDVYRPGTFELVGTLIGTVRAAEALPRRDRMKSGNLLVGLTSSGPHTNGYTLIRSVMEDRDLNLPVEPGGASWADALLAPHRAYAADVAALRVGGVVPAGIAHITGGGFQGNVGRLLPDGLGAVVDTAAWHPPSIFRQLVEWSGMLRAEAYRVFNMGIGLVLSLPPDQARSAVDLLDDACIMGRLEPGSGVRLE